MAILWSVLVYALAVRFGKQNTWATAPIAKVTVTARGAICSKVVDMHVLETKSAIRKMLENRTGGEEDLDDITVEVRRCLFVDDEHASISTSIVVFMTAGATTVLN